MKLKRLLIIGMLFSMAGSALAETQLQASQGNRLVPPPSPARRYNLAAPRAALVTPQVITPYAIPLRIGAAENFPRGFGSLKIRPGTKINFALSKEIEGVWYERSYGVLGTLLELQWCRYCKVTCDCVDQVKDIPEANAVDADSTTAATMRPAHWVTIGKDGARGLRHGPSIGHADVGVPVRFWRPGVYWLRGIITTTADPRYLATEVNTGDTVTRPYLGDKDRDVVYVRVQVVDWPEVIPDPDPAVSLEPDEAHAEDLPLDNAGAPRVVDAEIDGDNLQTWTE